MEQQQNKKRLIYTRLGDQGYTSLIGGKRIKKTHLRVEAYGTIDELNSYIGLLISLIRQEDDKSFLIKIQHHLCSFGASLATECEKVHDLYISEEIVFLENEIDKITGTITPSTSFVLPGGSQTAALSHVCRSVCRRAERRILGLCEKEIISSMILKYINRLSDYFFILAKKQNFINSINEIIFDKKTIMNK